MPNELTKSNAVVISRSKLEFIIGMVEGVSWTAPAPYSEALSDILQRLEKLKGEDV